MQAFGHGAQQHLVPHAQKCGQQLAPHAPTSHRTPHTHFAAALAITARWPAQAHFDPAVRARLAGKLTARKVGKRCLGFMRA